MTLSSDTALSHLRVIELGGLAVAGYAGHFLADLGADVIKIEPQGGDPARLDPPFAGDIGGPDRGLAFIHFNANKRSVVLDLDASEDRESLLHLTATADIVVEAHLPGRLASLGIGYSQLRETNPDLVLVSLTPFGQTGPLRGYRGNNAVAEAMSGMMFTLGDDARSPCISPNEILSQVAGLHGAYSALAAVFNRRKGGTGQQIDISLQEIGTHMQTGLAEYGLRGRIRRRPGTAPVGGATNIYQVQDGYVHHMPGQPHMWNNLVQWMNDPVLSGPEWLDREYRDQNADVVQFLVRDFVSRFTADEFCREAQRLGLPTSPINTVRQMVESPQAEALGSFVERTHPVIGTYKGIDFFRMSASPIAFRRPAPRIGEHQQEVLEETRRASTRHSPASGPARERKRRNRPLEGLRVLDFTRVIAGPAGTQFLAYLGADIIKVESADLPGGREQAAGFPDINRAKRSITLNARTSEGRELAFRLAAKSDVVVNNFSAHVMDRMGLGFEEMRKAKPDIIYISMPGFGKSGPIADWVAYGQTLQSYTGLVWLWRRPESPVEVGIKGPVADYVSVAELALAVVAAVEYRDRTGRGQSIDLAMLEGLASTLNPAYMDYMVNGRDPEPQGFLSARYAPYGCYPCRGEDTWCVISCETEEEWAAFGRAIGDPGWVSEERFATREGRIRHREELDQLVETWTREQTPRQVMYFLQAEGVPAGMVQSCEDLFVDYHLRARGHLVSVDHPAPWGSFTHQGLPARFSETAGDATIPTPTVGQHNEEVFGGLLGLASDEILRLREAKAIY